MSQAARFQQRISAAIKAFVTPSLVRSEKSWGSYSSYGYGSSDLTTGSAAAWSKYGAAMALLINHAVFACVTKRAETIAGLPFRVVDKETRKEVDAKQDPLMRALAAYSKHYGGQSLFQEWMYERDVTGEVYLEPLLDDSGRARGVDLLSSLNVNPYSLDGIHIDYFDYQCGVTQLRIPPDRLIYDRNTIARISAINGYSPILVAIGSNAAGVMQATGKAVLAYMNNDGIPATLVMKSGEGQLSLVEVENLQRIFKPGKNASGKYATAILPVHLDVTQTNQPDLLKWAELLRAVEPQIYTAFRTPRSVAGDSDSTSYQASPSDLVNFDAVMSATARDIALTINTTLAPLLYDDPEPSVEFEFETTELDHIPDSERQAARDAYELGTITMNQYLEAVGYEPIANGDIYRKPIGVEYVTAADLLPKPEPVITVTPPTPEPDTRLPAEAAQAQPPRQLPEFATARAAVDELDQYRQRVINGKAFKTEFVWNVIDAETGYCIEADVKAAEPDARMSVIGAWKAALKARDGITAYASKSTDELPDATQLYIKSLTALGFDAAQVDEAAAAHYASVIGVKALSNVRAQFEAACLRLMTRAVNERMTRNKFIADMEVTLFRYARLAMIEGYADGGIENYEPDDADDRYLLAFNDEQRTYIRGVADVLYADDVITEDEVRGKPQMWWNKSVVPAYNEGLTRASKDGIGVYYEGPTEDKCADCPRLHLQARKFSTWLKYFGGTLVPCDKTECGGFRCECVITPRKTAVSRGQLPRLVGYRKAVLTGVDLEVIRA